jgi:hypothetical protein
MKMKSPPRQPTTPSHVTRLRLLQLYAWREDVLTEGRPAPLPACPTEAPIGSPERLAIYEARAARGEQLHHPDDSRRARKRAADRLAARIATRTGRVAPMSR